MAENAEAATVAVAAFGALDEGEAAGAFDEAVSRPSAHAFLSALGPCLEFGSAVPVESWRLGSVCQSQHAFSPAGVGGVAGGSGARDGPDIR